MSSNDVINLGSGLYLNVRLPVYSGCHWNGFRSTRLPGVMELRLLGLLLLPELYKVRHLASCPRRLKQKTTVIKIPLRKKVQNYLKYIKMEQSMVHHLTCHFIMLFNQLQKYIPPHQQIFWFGNVQKNQTCTINLKIISSSFNADCNVRKDVKNEIGGRGSNP